MTLALTIRGLDRLDNGAPATLRLDRHGAIIGRSVHADWCLPDPKNHISSRHCEISFRDGAYVLFDRSTNGTFVHGSVERLSAPHRIVDGDRIVIGEFELVASGVGAASAGVAPEWEGWTPVAPTQPTVDSVTPVASVPLPFDRGGWDTPAPLTSSAWSSDPPQSQPASASDLWGELARRDQAAAPVPLPMETSEPSGWGPVSSHTAAKNLEADDLTASGAEPVTSKDATTARALQLLRRMVAGLSAMVEARARAKAGLGVVSTTIELEGNNPIKFIRAPEQVVEALLGTPQPGFMQAEVAIDDAFRDLQLHELATVAATRAAMEQTLKRFSPQAIRERRRDQGLLARLMPRARAAALWRAYEDEFEGVVRGADEAFVDLFEKAFRVEYARCLDAATRGRALP